MIDLIVSLALSMHTNRGVYALLLGSGVSRSAGIPTGWEVVLDLIRKLAHIQEANCEPNPAAWYKAQYGEVPDYSKLLDAIAKSPSERSQLLRSYFEPTEQEREQGLKVPTPAHKAIAKLVADGYIRVILTTNFDRLLEKALEAIGVVPTVISTSDSIDGAMPLIHTKCCIIKVHGDYLDTRIRNTTAELGQYDERLNRLLDRVFDEFGLIVCGWSAEWDTALRAAIQRYPNRRFTTYWAARREPQEIAKELLDWRKGVFVEIKDADSFFQELEEKVSALQEIDRPHPLSAKVAVATLKKYLVDEQHRIRLHDLVKEEREKLYAQLSLEHFPLDTPFSAQELRQRVQRYESLTEILIAVMVTGCYWGEESHEYLWTQCLERIANLHELKNGARPPLSLYPALVLLYAGGIASIAARNYGTFAALLTEPIVIDVGRNKPFLLSVNTDKVMQQSVAKNLAGMQGLHTPLSAHLYKVLRESLREFLPQDSDYEKCFDRFEYLLGLVHADLYLKLAGRLYGPVGRFGWKYEFGVEKGYAIYNNPIMEEIELESTNAGANWLPLTTGLFNGSIERFLDIKKAYDQLVKNWKGTALYH
jgi:hypothetical protein